MNSLVESFRRADFWNGDYPRRSIKISLALLRRQEQILQAVKDLSAEKNEDVKAVTTSALLSDIHDALVSLESLREEAQCKAFEGHPPTLQQCELMAKQLESFSLGLRIWLVIVLSARAGEAVENARVRFADAGAWAMHYSVVRMTVTTFFVGLIFGVIGVKWDEFDPSLRVAMWFAWGLAFLFLLLFTLPEMKKAEDQKKFQFEIPTLLNASDHQTISPRTRLLISMPFFLMALLTIGFFFLMRAWEHHTPAKEKGSAASETRIEARGDRSSN